MTAPLMPRATAVWLVENTTLTFRQISDFCEIHELEIQAIADGDVASNIMGLSPIDNNQLTLEEIKRCETDLSANLEANPLERNVKARNAKAKKILSPSQRSDKPSAISWVLKNYGDLTDTQICKLIGTTKPTIDAIRSGSHHDISNIRPKNPVTIGLCSEKDLDAALTLCQARKEKAVRIIATEKVVAPKKTKAPKAKKVKAEKKAKAPKAEKVKAEKKAKAPKAEKVKAEKKAKAPKAEKAKAEKKAKAPKAEKVKAEKKAKAPKKSA